MSPKKRVDQTILLNNTSFVLHMSGIYHLFNELILMMYYNN